MFTDVNTKDAYTAMCAGGHNFEVETVPLQLENGVYVPDKRATVRKDTGEYLGTVGRHYEIVQPVSFYDTARHLVESTGGIINKTLTLNGGSVIGISFRLGTREYISGDVTELNFLMMTSFNSSYAILGRALTYRWFCLNQLPSSKRLFSIKHTRTAEDRLGMAAKMLGYYGKEMEGFDKKMARLVQYRMPEPKQIEWFGNLLPAPSPDSKRSLTVYDNTLSDFQHLLHHGRGADHPGVRGTAYAALQALTEYCNHYRTTRVREGRDPEEVRFESVTFGSADKMMQTGFESLIKIAA